MASKLWKAFQLIWYRPHIGPYSSSLLSFTLQVVTGEEDESEMFAERAKLFRYVDEQWKERGVGMMKILKHKETGRNRLLMRRDQV